MLFRHYRKLTADIRRIALPLKGEIFRDAADLVICGNLQQHPTVIRFSRSENTPGLNVRMQAPATFGMSLTPKGAPPGEGIAVVRTSDDALDSRFVCRTDQPLQTRMFFANRETVRTLRSLCCSPRSYIAVTDGALELSELTIPTPAADHVLEHLDALAYLAEAMHAMPNADKVPIRRFERERRTAGRIALAVGVVAALAAVLAATQYSSDSFSSLRAAGPRVPPGVLPGDVQHLGVLTGWRVADESDFDPNAAAWLRANRKPVSGRVTGDFAGRGAAQDNAYLLRAIDGRWRVVLLVGGENLYDTQYPVIAIAARVPREAVNSIEWVGGKPPQPISGDGLLIVRKPDDAASGVVLFANGTRIVSGVPVDYQNIHLD
jgi:hypothetical protein